MDCISIKYKVEHLTNLTTPLQFLYLHLLHKIFLMNSINPFNEAATQTANGYKGHTLWAAMSKISYISETFLSTISYNVI